MSKMNCGFEENLRNVVKKKWIDKKMHYYIQAQFQMDPSMENEIQSTLKGFCTDCGDPLEEIGCCIDCTDARESLSKQYDLANK